MYSTIKKSEIVNVLAGYEGLVICNLPDTISLLKESNPKLYLRELKSITIGEYPDATYVLNVPSFLNVDEFCSSLGDNITAYIINIDEEEEEKEELVPVPEDAVNEMEISAEFVDFDVQIMDFMDVCDSPETEYASSEDEEITEEEGYELEETEEVEEEPTLCEKGETVEIALASESETQEQVIVKPYEDEIFDTFLSMTAVLNPDMKVVASKTIADKVHLYRPDIDVEVLRSGAISETEGCVVLLNTRTKIHRKEVRRVYPSTATLFMVKG